MHYSTFRTTGRAKRSISYDEREDDYNGDDNTDDETGEQKGDEKSFVTKSKTPKPKRQRSSSDAQKDDENKIKDVNIKIIDGKNSEDDFEVENNEDRREK